MSEWTVVLNGTVLAGGQIPELIGSVPASGIDVLGWLSNPPEGLGVPPLRTEDQTFPQRDGVAQYSDWYEPRVITLADVSVTPDGCPSCPTAREKAYALSSAWARNCGQTELVIYSDCHSPAASGAFTGPYGVIGRPRVADVRWVGQGSKVGTGLFRFDSVDHRLYLLDPSGTPGSGVHDQELALFDPAEGAYQQWVIDHPDAARYWMLSDVGTTAVDSIGTDDGTFPGGSDVDQAQLPILSGTSPSVLRGGANIALPFPGFSTAVTVERVARIPEVSFPADIHSFESADGDFSLRRAPGGGDTLRWRGVNHTLDNITSDILHLAVVQSGTDLLVYVNGLLNQTFTGIATGAVGAQDWEFPASTDVDYRIWYSDVAVYSDGLTALEVADHYALAVDPNPHGLPLFEMEGNACVPFTLTLPNTMSNPRLFIGNSYIGVTSFPTDEVTIDTATGDLTYVTPAGTVVSDPSLITGDPFLQLNPPGPSMALYADPGSTGTATLSYRAAVISA